MPLCSQTDGSYANGACSGNAMPLVYGNQVFSPTANITYVPLAILLCVCCHSCSGALSCWCFCFCGLCSAASAACPWRSGRLRVCVASPCSPLDILTPHLGEFADGAPFTHVVSPLPPLPPCSPVPVGNDPNTTASTLPADEQVLEWAQELLTL